MKFELKFGCDNSAFDGDNLNYEIAGILRDIAGRIENGRSDGNVLDSNGNGVGTFAIVGRPARKITRASKRK